MPGVERKLAAILSADVVGYSRLMAEDEDATVRTLNAYREQVGALVGEHRGRVVDFTGDNFLAEFPTATDAVEAAAQIQRVIHARNAAVPADRAMEFRIGVHLGEVRVEDERIYGDGVNIAARLEGLAPPGGVCVSASVRSEVRNKLGLDYRDLGPQQVKNIPEPVHAYAIALGQAAALPTAEGAGRRPLLWLVAAVVVAVVVGAGLWVVEREPGTAPSPAITAPDLSVAVLPFTNMSGDPEQEYFSDGMTEDIITDLSQVSGLLVIARNSSFTYKGRAVNVGDVGRELGVRYVLEGSVRKAGDRVRVNAQLVEAATGHHLWAERYDRDLKDVFAVQDELTGRIVAALEVRLADAEAGLRAAAPTAEPEAYDLYLRALSNSDTYDAERAMRARAQLTRAIELDPEFGRAHAQLAVNYARAWVGQRSEDPGDVDRAIELARKAIQLAPDDSATLSAASAAHQLAGRFEEALSASGRAIELNPNDVAAYRIRGMVLNHNNRPQEALEALKEARRRDPRDPSGAMQFQMGISANLTGQREDALALLHEAVQVNPDFLPAHLSMAATYFRMGEEAKARAEVREVLRIQPDFSIDKWARRLPMKGDARDRVVTAWRALAPE